MEELEVYRYRRTFKLGADKIAINSYAIENPKFITEAVSNFGSSTIVIYIEAKQVSTDKWEIFKFSGREKQI